MAKSDTLRTLLPAKAEHTVRHSGADSAKERRRNVSIACTECRRKRTKVRQPNPYPRIRRQCSGTTPCTSCKNKQRQCLYDPTKHQRNAHPALCRVVTKLRSGTSKEILQFVLRIRSLKTDGDAVSRLLDDSIPEELPNGHDRKECN
ncbi:uncharacterized protein N7458_002591 [Penicillium daleae]|uniref:Zn(2)-C6 fungal-type domain-containing protein n=1 Tax=Penicillium daleae TaxID=63821 RepID=A0AAD6CD97_9EURO|nr:uncharacterized protein N7458_002591 [Penicillium daleae]KAJ5461039.1 hypothetical protein N7458_002591 [Penicillium daleae]